jgi:beta-barrel assembly-enhancing protease
VTAVAATLFRPGLPAAGRTAQVQLHGDRLHITQDAHTDIVACAQCTAAVGGFNHDQLQLQWTDAHTQAQHALIPLTAADQAALLAQLTALPHEVMPTLARWRRTTSRQRWVWQTVLGSVATLAVATVLLVWQHDRVVQWLTWQIPRDVETRLGEGLVAQLKRDKTLLDKGQAVATMKQIGDRLTAGSAYRYQWYVVDDKSVNAFALPGGIIVVHSGLLQIAASADEVASVLAHEVQHVEQRHALRNMVNQAGLAAAMLVVLGDVNSVVLLIAHQASAQYFSRGMETEADMQGVRLLHERKFLTQPMVSMFEKLKQSHAGKIGKVVKKPEAKSEEDSDDALGWLSSHPQVDERLRAIQAFVAANPCADCRAVPADWPAAQADLKTQLGQPNKP